MNYKKEYIELRNTINDCYSTRITYNKKKYDCLLAGDVGYRYWYRSGFYRLSVKGVFSRIPAIEICTKGIGKDWQYKMTILAHEFGHYLSWKNGEANNDGAYKKFLSSKPITNKEAKIILEEEMRAWRYGFRFLDDNGIEVEPEMRNIRDRCLRRYRDSTKRAVK